MGSMTKRAARRNRVRISRPRGHHTAGARTQRQIGDALFAWRAAWREWFEEVTWGRLAVGRAPGWRPTRGARL